MYHSSGKTLLPTSTTILSANTACLPTLAFVEKNISFVHFVDFVGYIICYLYRYPLSANNLLACRRNQSSSAGRAYHCIIIISGSITTTIIIIRIIILKTDLELNQKDREPATNIIVSIKSICLSSSECSSTSFEEISV